MPHAALDEHSLDLVLRADALRSLSSWLASSIALPWASHGRRVAAASDPGSGRVY